MWYTEKKLKRQMKIKIGKVFAKKTFYKKIFKEELTMAKYSKPMVTVDQGLAEGVYAASGAGCYTATAKINQTPQTGRGDYRIQVNGKHNADHTKKAQILTISFNLPVTYVSCNGNGASLQSGDGTNTLVINLGYQQNSTDSIGFGDLIVTADSGLAITGVSITD